MQFFKRGQLSWLDICFYMHQAPLKMWSILKGENLLLRCKFFPFIAAPIDNEANNIFDSCPCKYIYLPTTHFTIFMDCVFEQYRP